MCCRYYMEESPELRPFVEAARRSSILPKMVEKLARSLVTEGEVRPTDIVPVLARNRHDQDAVYPMIWGFTRENAPALFNARSETAHHKPFFKNCWERRRCIVPASWYYEWEHLTDQSGKKKTGDRYLIQPKDSRLTLLAGLYRIEEDGFPHFVVLTREPSEAIAFIHDRMPVILPETSAEKWIHDMPEKGWTESHALTDMIYEKNSAGEAARTSCLWYDTGSR